MPETEMGQYNAGFFLKEFEQICANFFVFFYRMLESANFRAKKTLMIQVSRPQHLLFSISVRGTN